MNTLMLAWLYKTKKLLLVTDNNVVQEVQEVQDPKLLSCSIERQNIVSIHEFTFDQKISRVYDHDPSMPAPTLWFNIPDDVLKEAALQDVDDS